ncbi:restriction endonuclease subunit S [Shinella sp. H4-D48]|uniref:restriction endonuclease subunit S n=1 Tax=Shinella sp. H4-D48 TaxID=2925841 RepID=UPI001F532A0C|nr:restriction endonuclease subunit S [Shinella sp. H4-D48]UNK37489.1 restriction endonuclease subunit S [Shinella sp. H4-D48]
MSPEVAEGWRLTAFSDIASDVSARNRSRDEIPVLSVTKYDGFVPSEEYFKKKVFSADTENYKIVRNGQFAYATIHLDEGSIDRLTRFDMGLISPMYTVFEIDERQADPDFILRLFKLYATNGQFDALGNGGVNRRKSISFSTLGKLSIPLPPLHEQRRIAEILSSADEAIAATRTVIEQTRKVRSEILSTSFPEHRAVGRSTADDTFKGWSVEPASSICESIIDCKNRTPPVTENGYAVVRTPNVRNGRFRYDGLQFTDKQSFQEWTAKGVPRAGDILFTREAPYGEVCMAPAMAFCLGQRMMFMRPDTSRVSSDFLLYALQSGAVKQEMFRRAGGSTVGHLRVGDVRALPIPVAPREVQLRLTSTLRSLDEALHRNEKTLSRLEDCKSALMSDVLTGRKRVTDALPMAAE